MRSYPLTAVALSFHLSLAACDAPTADGSVDVATDEAAFTVAPHEIVASFDERDMRAWRGRADAGRRAIAFVAEAGDKVELRVRGIQQSWLQDRSTGDPAAWLVTSGGAVIAFNDDADATTKDARIEAVLAAGTYYLVFVDREDRMVRLFEASIEIDCAVPGTTKTRACGAGGTKPALCVAHPTAARNSWTEYGACTGERPDGCVPGATATETCGRCGTRTKTCDAATFTWRTTACSNEVLGGCVPGAIEASTAGCSQPGTVRRRTCGSSCRWSSFGATCHP